MDKYLKISKIFNYFELCTLENALAAYQPKNLTQEQMVVFEELKRVIIDARRWQHHFGKSER